MPKDFNSPQVIENYDDHIRKLIPGYELIHLQVTAILKTYLAEQHKQNTINILIVGCGTGYELQYLAEQFPEWHFTAIDPALGMLQKAQQHIEILNLTKNITFIHADTSVLKSLDVRFDAALSILVSHFVPKPDKPEFFKDLYGCLKQHGLSISYDLTHIQNHQELETLKILTESVGLTEKQSSIMTERITHDFYLSTFAEMQQLYQQAHFSSVKSFAQVLNYYGFIAFKSEH